MKLKIILAVAGSLITYFLGGYDLLIQTLIIFVIIDYMAGVLAAVKEKRLNSEVGFWGIIKKILFFVAVGVAHCLDTLLMEQGNFELPLLRTVTAWGFIINECFSIVENLGLLGVKLPKMVTDTLEKLKTGGNENG